jgi:hypothetical protein
VHRAEPLRELAAAYPRAQLLGCSTAGEIFGTSIRGRTVSVAICRFEATRLRSASAPVAAAADSGGRPEPSPRPWPRPICAA